MPKRRDEVWSVSEALERELARMPLHVRRGTPAAQARVLAAVLDDPDVGAALKPACNRELRETLVVLRAAAPVEPLKDAIDELHQRRAKRRTGTQA